MHMSRKALRKDFYMDIRMFGPGYEEMYREAQQKYNIHFIRGRISEASPMIDGRVQIKAEDTLTGRPLRMSVDMLILIVGMRANDDNAAFAEGAGLNRAPSGFMAPRDMFLGNVKSNVEGIFYAGTVTAPKNIGESLNEGTAAADAAARYNRLIEEAKEKGISLPEIDELQWQGGRDEYAAKAESVGVLRESDTDLRSLKELMTYGLKGMAAYLEHAMRLGYDDASIHTFKRHNDQNYEYRGRKNSHFITDIQSDKLHQSPCIHQCPYRQTILPRLTHQTGGNGTSTQFADNSNRHQQ